MEISKTVADELFAHRYSERFDNTFVLNEEVYHYFVHDSIFFAQVCRAYSLLANELGVSSAEYDYIKRGQQIVSYVKSIKQPDEELIETAALDADNMFGFDQWKNEWIQFMEVLPFEDREKADRDFYKQWFYGLLIFDDDKQIALVKNKDGKYRIGDYFDYGGVYMFQYDNQVDYNIYYDEEAYLEYAQENEYSKEQLAEDIAFTIREHIIGDYMWNEGNDDLLAASLPYLDEEFINKCFTIKIEDVLDKDKYHEYSDNFKKVIGAMFETSRTTVMNKVKEMRKNDQNNQSPLTGGSSKK